MLQSICN